MKLKKILLRYFPPGITLEYVRSNGEIESKCIDLLNLSSEYIEALCSTNIDQLIDEIVQEEPLITETRRPQIRSMIVSKLTLYCRADRKD
jgi:dynein assembly factor with WDR repeat domains 1